MKADLLKKSSYADVQKWKINAKFITITPK
jgi:hypothetical protein